MREREGRVLSRMVAREVKKKKRRIELMKGGWEFWKGCVGRNYNAKSLLGATEITFRDIRAQLEREENSIRLGCKVAA